MVARISSRVMCFGMSSSRRSSMASSQASGAGPLELLEHLEQDLAADLLVDSVLLRVEVHEVLHVDHVVREDLVVLVADVDDGVAHAAGRQGLCLCTGQTVPGMARMISPVSGSATGSASS